MHAAAADELVGACAPRHLIPQRMAKAGPEDTLSQVAMGFGHSLFLVDPDHPKVGELPVWDVAAEDAAAPANGTTSKSGKAAAAPAGKRKAAGAASAGARKRK